MPYGTDAPAGSGLLIILPRDNPGPVDAPLRWKYGEVTQVKRVEDLMGWQEVPQNYLGDFTVEQLNSRPLANHLLFETARVTNAGTLTQGSQTTDVQAGDSVLWQYPGYWRNFGAQTNIPPYNRCHIIIDNRTFEETVLYMEAYNIKVDMETIAGPDPDGLRRIQVDNLRVSASGRLAFTDEGTANVVTEWNAVYPTAELVRISWDQAQVVYEGTFTQGQADEFEEYIIRNAGAQYADRRRWYVPPSDMQQIIDGNGWVSGPSQNVTLRDRVLD